MAFFEWWAPTLQEKLSQGDIVREIPFASLAHPQEYLRSFTQKGNKLAWEASPSGLVSKSDKRIPALTRLTLLPALVISHSCELDKDRDRPRVLVAPIGPISALPIQTQAAVLQQRQIALMPLPEIPQIGPSYADLRLISPISREAVESTDRIASMTEPALDRLHAHLVMFFLRKELP